MWNANKNNWQEAQSFSISNNNFSYSNGGSGNVGNYIVGDPIIYPDNYWGYQPIYDYYYRWYWPTTEVRYEKSKVDLAFKIIKVLIDKKIINADKLNVGNFIDLVQEISKEL